MLPPANRLKKEKEIRRALSGKNGRQTALLVCKTAANDLDTARFCLVVSKKISANATVRNKLKRRLRAAVAANLADARPGADCVLIARPGLETKPYAEIKVLVRNVLAAAGVLEISQMSKPKSQNHNQ